MFKNGFGGVSAADGVQWAELNAYTPSRLYQTVCLLEGDRVKWFLHHKARVTGQTESMVFNIGIQPDGSDAVSVVQGTTDTSGAGSIANNSCLGECAVTTVINDWARYSGSFEWNNPSGERTIGFQSLSPGAAGNYLDSITIYGVSPIAELSTDEARGLEGEHSATNFPISILVSGKIPVGETLDVEVAIIHFDTDGADISPMDTVTISIPPGDYAAEPFPIPIAVLADDVRENREQFRIELVDKPGEGGYRVGSTTSCGAQGIVAATYTILDAHASIEKIGTFVDLVGGMAPDGSPIKNAGDRMDYEFIVTNTGDVTLTNLAVTDTIIGTPTLDPSRSGLDADGNLPAGAVAVYVASYTLTQADVDSGQKENVATFTANLVGREDQVTATSDHQEPLPHIPAISMIKEGSFDPETDDGDGLPDPGERLRFDITVTNDGNVTAFNVEPKDPGPTFDGQPGTGVMTPFSPGPSAILPGESLVFTAYYTLTTEDIAYGSGLEDAVKNQASVSATDPTGAPLEATMPEPMAFTMPGFGVEKRAEITQTQRGGKVPYTLILKPMELIQTTRIRLADIIPAGFVYIPGTAVVDGQALEPVIEGRRLSWEIDVEPERNVEVQLVLGVSASAPFGTFVNTAQAERIDNDVVYRRKGYAEVEIIPEPVFDCGDIIGKVFNDENRNGYQDKGEGGIAGARVTSVDGIQITTDSHGRFSVACADLPNNRIGKSYLMKLDPRSLPAGYRILSENPRVIRLTAGKMSEISFATSIARVVRIDVTGVAFIAGSTSLSPVWQQSLTTLLETLATEPSVLRIAYRDTAGEKALANQRLRALRSTLNELWKAKPNRYRLEIETSLITGKTMESRAR